MPGTTAALNLPGSALARATQLLRSGTFIAVGTPTPRIVFDTRAIGTRSAGVYGSLSYWNGCTVKLPEGVNRKVWSSLAERNDWIASSPSPPGRFSITTGLPPQRAGNRSDRSRAPMSAPAPGPNGTTSRTGRCGQLCACESAGVVRTARPVRTAAAVIRNAIWRMAIPPSDSSSDTCEQMRCESPSNVSVQTLPLGGCFMNGGDAGALVFDRGGELLGRAAACNAADPDDTGTERRIGDDRGDIGDDAPANLGRHVAPAIDAGDTLEGEVTIAGLGCGRHIGRLRGALAVGHEQELRIAGPMMRRQRRHAGAGDMQPATCEVLIGRREVAIGNVRHLDARVALQREQYKDRQAGRCRVVELAGLRLRRRHELGQRVDFQGRARGDAEKIVDRGRERHELFWIIGQPLVQQVIEAYNAAEREQKGVIVARGEEGGDCRNAICALAVLHHDRLPPALGQPLGDQPRGKVHAAAGRQREDEAHGFLRPRLSRGLRMGTHTREAEEGDEPNKYPHGSWHGFPVGRASSLKTWTAGTQACSRAS